MQIINGCKYGKISVLPANWESPDADMSKPWLIHYRFYDASGKVRSVQIRGMNFKRKWKERKEATEYSLKQEIEKLKNGYNPIIGPSSLNKQDYIIDPSTPFIEALRGALERIKIEPKTRNEIKAMLKHIGVSALVCRVDSMKIGDIRKRHIKMILEQLGRTRVRWTANTFNHYKKYISMLFSELEKVEAVDYNPVKKIAKEETVEKIRVTLTLKERERINEHLRRNYYRFWLFMQIFFHSGSRETELLQIKGKDVDLNRQFIRITIKKGKKHKQVTKTIKDIALPYWEEAIRGCSDDHYVFSKGLKHGTAMIRPEQVSRRWRAHVKTKLGIKADMYSLKHSNTDELASLLSMDEARKHNSHTSEKTTLIYAVNEREREHERIKKIGNKFA